MQASVKKRSDAVRGEGEGGSLATAVGPVAARTSQELPSANLDALMQSLQSYGAAPLGRNHAKVLLQRAGLDLNYLHHQGEVLQKKSKQQNLIAYLDYVKVDTLLSTQQKNGFLPGDTADYRIWTLSWRMRGVRGTRIKFVDLVPLVQGVGELQLRSLFAINETVMVLNTLEKMHRGRQTMLKTLMLELAQIDMLKKAR